MSLLDQRPFVEDLNTFRDRAESDGPVIAVLDEMSTQANAQTSNYEVNDRLYPVITFKSKLDLRLIIIGHREDGNDIAPAVREHADYFIQQRREEQDYDDDVYLAGFHEGLEDGEPVDEQFTLRPVPEAWAYYNPDETATFDLSE